MSIRANFTAAGRGTGRRALRALLAAALAASVLLPAPAFADVRGTDQLLGTTVAERGLPAVACPNVTARYAFVMDAAGTVYFSREADVQSHIASITKVMTAIVALDSGMPMDTVITVGEKAATVGESSADLRMGDKLSLKAALTGLMVSSGNDAAIAIAETVGATLAAEGQDANEAFVAAMNAKAAELGMNDSLFANPHGLDIGEYDNEMYSTAHDVGLMCAYAMKNETFRSIVAQDKAQLAVTKPDGSTATIELTSTDLLLGAYEGACGIKTGYTEAAGNSFAGACNRGDGDLYAIVLGAPSESARFEDAKALFNWVYDNRMTYVLAHSDQWVTADEDGTSAKVPLIAEVPHTAWLDKRVKATFADPDASVEVFAPEGNVSQELVTRDLPGAVHAGDVVGTMNFYQGNELIASQDLVAVEDSPAPDFLQGIGFWWERLWAGFGGRELVAAPVVVNQTPLIYSKASTGQSIEDIRAIAAGDDVVPDDDSASDGADEEE
ncbi:D-alanyl-D-alanine carboxypeptidase family protein [Adlercreutzia sp. R21]|uniref:D-alanyl-D-alanine carboxypeptidase family protein n=1 Tax=Adlercreutzia wanghongyangiae TaxID=3111451 RepID=UPI002DBA2C1F|nr:D-alanyl-D-alanine carboxypeptidase family protein [Adlercreutzia sp. R21]MEC4184129.1 D-alanyl-D-alanine carboxypeptidase family protein [Adlercreutzia sp. R21]